MLLVGVCAPCYRFLSIFFEPDFEEFFRQWSSKIFQILLSRPPPPQSCIASCALVLCCHHHRRSFGSQIFLIFCGAFLCGRRHCWKAFFLSSDDLRTPWCPSHSLGYPDFSRDDIFWLLLVKSLSTFPCPSRTLFHSSYLSLDRFSPHYIYAQRGSHRLTWLAHNVWVCVCMPAAHESRNMLRAMLPIFTTTEEWMISLFTFMCIHHIYIYIFYKNIKRSAASRHSTYIECIYLDSFSSSGFPSFLFVFSRRSASTYCVGSGDGGLPATSCWLKRCLLDGRRKSSFVRFPVEVVVPVPD